MMRKWTVELIPTPSGMQAWVCRDGLQQAYVQPAIYESGESIAQFIVNACNAAEQLGEVRLHYFGEHVALSGFPPSP